MLSSKRSSDPVIEARRARVLELPRRPAVPEGADAELVALLAPAGTLPIQRDADRLLARLRLTEIGRLTDPPPHVRDLMTQRKLTPGDGPAFANALIPGTRDPSHFHESGAGMFGSS